MSNAHILKIDPDGVLSMDHPANCTPSTCHYVSLSFTEAAKKQDKPEQGKIAVYSVTGGAKPKFERKDDEDDPDSPGQDSDDPDKVYDLIEDREAYEAEMEKAGEVWLDIDELRAHERVVAAGSRERRIKR